MLRSEQASSKRLSSVSPSAEDTCRVGGGEAHRHQARIRIATLGNDSIQPIKTRDRIHFALVWQLELKTWSDRLRFKLTWIIACLSEKDTCHNQSTTSSPKGALYLRMSCSCGRLHVCMYNACRSLFVSFDIHLSYFQLNFDNKPNLNWIMTYKRNFKNFGALNMWKS